MVMGTAGGSRSVGERAPKALCTLGELRSNSVSEPQANGAFVTGRVPGAIPPEGPAVVMGTAGGSRSVGERAPNALCTLGELRSNSVSEP